MKFNILDKNNIKNKVGINTKITSDLWPDKIFKLVTIIIKENNILFEIIDIKGLILTINEKGRFRNINRKFIPAKLNILKIYN